MSAPKWIVMGVFAGAYLRGDKRVAFLTHAVVNGAALCGKVKPDNLCDDSGSPQYAVNGVPTCKGCCRKLTQRGEVLGLLA